MSDSFYGEIKMFAGTFAPYNWSFCEGQMIPVSQNQVLFSLLGVTYGGDGYNTFALPNMKGSAPMHSGNYHQGDKIGSQYANAPVQCMPSHNHNIAVNTNASESDNIPGSKYFTNSASTLNTYSTNLPTQTNLNSNSISIQGGNQPHSNMQPYLGINYIICMDGTVYPQRQ